MHMYLFEIESLYTGIDQVGHRLSILINGSTALHTEEQVGDLCTFTFYDGREDTVKVFEVYWTEAGGNTTIQEDQLRVVHTRILDENVAGMKVSVDKVMYKELEKGGRREVRRI